MDPHPDFITIIASTDGRECVQATRSAYEQLVKAREADEHLVMVDVRRLSLLVAMASLWIERGMKS